MNVSTDELSVNDDGAAGDDNLSLLDDSALLSWRAQARAELERIPPASPEHAALAARYDQSTAEVTERARQAWSRAN